MKKSAGEGQTRITGLWLLLAALPLASGAALVVYVLTSISLGLALLGAGVIVVATGFFAWMRLTSSARIELLWRIKVGLVAGFLATIAYDVSRWVFVTFFHDTFAPFDVFPIFGHAIAGANLSPAAATAIGLLYHYINGVMFAIGYAILFASRGWWAGVLWALGLEALMLTVYPGWLHPTPFREFVSVSVLGHVAYGSVLGSFSRWNLARQRNTIGDISP